MATNNSATLEWLHPKDYDFDRRAFALWWVLAKADDKDGGFIEVAIGETLRGQTN